MQRQDSLQRLFVLHSRAMRMVTLVCRIPADVHAGVKRLSGGRPLSVAVRAALRAYTGRAQAGERVGAPGADSETLPPEAGPRRRSVRVMLSAGELTALERAAKRGGFAGVAKYMGALVRGHMHGASQAPSLQFLEEIGRSNYQLARLGVNLNQVAKALNMDLKDGRAVTAAAELKEIPVLRERIGRLLDRHVALIESYAPARR